MEREIKKLIGQGKYREALGDKYNDVPYYIMDFKNGFNKDPIHIDEYFRTRMLADGYCSRNCINKYMVGNLNDDWI